MNWVISYVKTAYSVTVCFHQRTRRYVGLPLFQTSRELRKTTSISAQCAGLVVIKLWPILRRLAGTPISSPPFENGYLSAPLAELQQTINRQHRQQRQSICPDLWDQQVIDTTHQEAHLSFNKTLEGVSKCGSGHPSMVWLHSNTWR